MYKWFIAEQYVNEYCIYKVRETYMYALRSISSHVKPFVRTLHCLVSIMSLNAAVKRLLIS